MATLTLQPWLFWRATSTDTIVTMLLLLSSTFDAPIRCHACCTRKITESARKKTEISKFQGGSGTQNHIITTESASTTEFFALWPLTLSAKRGSPLEQVGVWFRSCHRVAQEPNRNRKPDPSEPFFPQPKAEPEPFSGNRNRNRPFLLNCTEIQKNPFCRGIAGTENRNRLNRSISKP